MLMLMLMLILGLMPMLMLVLVLMLIFAFILILIFMLMLMLMLIFMLMLMPMPMPIYIPSLYTYPLSIYTYPLSIYIHTFLRSPQKGGAMTKCTCVYTSEVGVICGIKKHSTSQGVALCDKHRKAWKLIDDGTGWRQDGRGEHVSLAEFKRRCGFVQVRSDTVHTAYPASTAYLILSPSYPYPYPYP
jgi:hypothetical protein